MIKPWTVLYVRRKRIVWNRQRIRRKEGDIGRGGGGYRQGLGAGGIGRGGGGYRQGCGDIGRDRGDIQYT